MEPHCFACNYAVKPPYPLLETTYWDLYLSEEQAYLGRSYLTLKKHKPDLTSLDAEEWQDYIELVKRIEAAYQKAFKATPIGWMCLMNNAFRDHPAFPHVHWHVIPRHKEPIEINGEVFTDELYGEYHDSSLHKDVSPATFVAIMERIKQYL